jgi:hypothetical protein
MAFGAQGLVRVKVKRANAWLTSLSLPFYGVSSRPPLYRLYKVDDVSFDGIASSLHSNLTASHFGRLFYLRLQTEYRFPIAGNDHESLHYTVEFSRVKQLDGNPFTQLIHQVGISFFL